MEVSCQEIETFGYLIENLYKNKDQNFRSNSIEEYKNLAFNQPDKLVTLLYHLQKSSDPDWQTAGLILLRKSVLSGEEHVWSRIQQQTRDFIASKVIESFMTVDDLNMRSKIDELIVELIAFAIKANDWDKWKNFLNYQFPNGKTIYLESILNIFYELATHHQSCMISTDLMEIYLNYLNVALYHESNSSVRVKALEKSCGAISWFSQYRTNFHNMLPQMMHILQDSFNLSSKEAAMALDAFLEWSSEPAMFKPQIKQIFDLFMYIGEKTPVAEHKQKAVDFIVSVIAQKPNFVKTMPQYIDSLCDLILLILTDLDNLNEKEWNEIDEEYRFDLSNADSIEVKLNELSSALGNTLANYIIPKIVIMIKNSDWKYRHGGLIALSIIGEDCHDEIESSLADIMQLIMPCTRDQNARVRWAALTTIAQYCTDFSPNFVDEFHQIIFETIENCLMDESNPKIQLYATTSVVNAVENNKIDSIIPHLDSLLHKLYLLLNSSDAKLLGESVIAIGTLASKSGDLFISYYDSIVPILNSILERSFACRENSLSNKIVEAVSLIGVAAGKEKFFPEAMKYLEALKSADWGTFGGSENAREVLLSSAVRICQCLGTDCVQYLPTIIPRLIETMQVEGIIYSDNEVTDNGISSEGWMRIVLDKQQISWNTAILDEKKVACDMMYSLIDTVEDLISDYVQQIIPIVVELLDFSHKPVRKSVTHCVYALLKAAKTHALKGRSTFNDFKNLWHELVYLLIESVNRDESFVARTTKYEVICECINLLQTGQLDEEECNFIVSIFTELISSIKESYKSRERLIKSGELEEESLDELKIDEDEEADACYELSNVCGILARNHPNVYRSVFMQVIIGPVLDIINQNVSPHIKYLSIVLLADATENLNETIYTFYDKFIPAALECALSENAHLRFSSFYLLGSCAKNGPRLFEPYVPDAINAIFAIVNDEESKNDECASATECAICAYTKILFLPSLKERLPELLSALLNWIPLVVEELEAVVCHDLVCKLVKENIVIVVQNENNLYNLLMFFMWCFTPEADSFTGDQIHQDIRSIFKLIQLHNPPKLTQILDSLEPNIKDLLSG